jgi:sugar/nucleoside kinase (ribokinase family)
MEGYLYDEPEAQAAFRHAAAVAHAAGRRVSLSLSDSFCVNRHRAAFRDLVRGHVDILFANEAEICALYECNDLADAIARTRADVALAAITRGGDGSVVVRGGETVEVAAEPTRVVDTTGAGDAYAAGFLAALTAGRGLAACGRLGSIAAAEIISHYGARLQRDLKGVFANLA